MYTIRGLSLSEDDDGKRLTIFVAGRNAIFGHKIIIEGNETITKETIINYICARLKTTPANVSIPFYINVDMLNYPQ